MSENLSFEEYLAKLNAITEKLQKKDITIDLGIALYQEGLELTKHCLDILKNAKGKISIIKKEFDTLSEVPFDEEI